MNVCKVLGVYSEFPLSPDSPKPLGALPIGSGGSTSGDGDNRGDDRDSDSDNGNDRDGNGDNRDDRGNGGAGAAARGDSSAGAAARVKVVAPRDAGVGAKFTFVPP